MRAALTILVIAAVLGLAPASGRAGPMQDLERAQQSFRNKDCGSAIPVLKDLLYPQPKLARTSDLVEAHILLGVCHYESAEREEAKRQFEAALALDPSKTLEPLIYTEAHVRVFDETRADVSARIERDRKLRELEEERERFRRLVESSQVFETRSYFVNFVPFGAGQFQNKQTTKGILFAAGQGLGFGVSAGIFLYLAGNYGLDAKVPLEEGPRIRRLQQIEIAAGGAFFAFYAWSVVDALLNYKARERIEVDPALLEDLKKRSAPKKTSLRERLRFGPVLLPGGAGVGLSLENF